MDGSLFVLTIEEALRKRGIAKATFYKETGISSATFSQWRNGVYSPSSAAISKVENYLGITTFFGQKEKPSTENGERLEYSDMELLEAIRKADAKDLKAIRVILGIE